MTVHSVTVGQAAQGKCVVTFDYDDKSRLDVATVTSGSPVVADLAILAADSGRPVASTAVPSDTGAYVGTVTVGASFRLSLSATSQVDVSAIANDTSILLIGKVNPVVAVHYKNLDTIVHTAYVYDHAGVLKFSFPIAAGTAQTTFNIPAVSQPSMDTVAGYSLGLT